MKRRAVRPPIARLSTAMSPPSRCGASIWPQPAWSPSLAVSAYVCTVESPAMKIVSGPVGGAAGVAVGASVAPVPPAEPVMEPAVPAGAGAGARAVGTLSGDALEGSAPDGPLAL